MFTIYRSVCAVLPFCIFVSLYLYVIVGSVVQCSPVNEATRVLCPADADISQMDDLYSLVPPPSPPRVKWD